MFRLLAPGPGCFFGGHLQRCGAHLREYTVHSPKSTGGAGYAVAKHQLRLTQPYMPYPGLKRPEQSFCLICSAAVSMISQLMEASLACCCKGGGYGELSGYCRGKCVPTDTVQGRGARVCTILKCAATRWRICSFCGPSMHCLSIKARCRTQARRLPATPASLGSCWLNFEISHTLSVRPELASIRLACWRLPYSSSPPACH